jgi:hypothetical protein
VSFIRVSFFGNRRLIMAEQQPHELSDAGRQELEAGREARAKSLEEFAARTKGKPTPTQAENDEAALGKSFVGIEHEPDGGDPDPHGQVAKQMEHKPSGGNYQTRQARTNTPPQHSSQQQPPKTP